MDEAVKVAGGDEDWPVGLPRLRSILTTRGMAWFDPVDVKTIRRLTDDERASAKVPKGWGVALRLRIRGDEVWTVRGDPWPVALADVVDGGDA